jgi:hypothetical protein
VKAAFNSTDRECCTESTRITILEEIYEWIGTDGSGSSECRTKNTDLDRGQQQSRILWLNGSAGTGKTTIAYTVAQYCNDRKPGVLGASFFCSRDDANCSNPQLIFTTIAYQLSFFNSQFAAEVSKVLKAAPDIGYASVQYQLEELIVNPLRVARDSFTRCIVVLDALDECKDTATVLTALSSHIEELSPLQFLVTSRPENRIRMAFTLQDLHHNTKQLLLHQVKLELVEQDISHYLSLKLVETRRKYEIKDSWPAPSSIDSLAKLSSGLFIFAATSIKYIEDAAYSDPRGQLQRLVDSSAEDMGKSSPFKRLDLLYIEVLTLAFPEISTSLLGLLKMVLGSIVYLQDPLSVISLERLLGLGAGRVREILLHLHAILIVPQYDSHVIRLLHPSFPDFITNPERCSITKYVVKLDEQQTLLAESCLEVMKGLHRDICQIKNPSLLNSEITDLPAQIGKYIPAHIQYACRHWAHHVSKSMMSYRLLDLLKDFCEQHLLHWIEVCSLLGELRGVLLSVAEVLPTLLVIFYPASYDIALI